MAIAIKAATVSEADANRTSIEHASAAGLACLADAGLGVDDVDFLVNVGVFRHHNMCEPAMCALIQNAMQMCPDARKHPVKKNVFSFDLNNGGCGVLSAATVLGPMLEARGLEHALIVAADCHPSGAPHDEFPFASMGGALLISRIDGPDRTLGRVTLRTSPEPMDGQRGGCDIAIHGTRSRVTIEIDREDHYLERLTQFAAQTAREHLAEQDFAPDNVLLVCSQPSASFAADLAERIGVPSSAVIHTYAEHGDVHTSSLALGYNQASATGRLGERAAVLLVEAGGGLTAACALYS